MANSAHFEKVFSFFFYLVLPTVPSFTGFSLILPGSYLVLLSFSWLSLVVELQQVLLRRLDSILFFIVSFFFLFFFPVFNGFSPLVSAGVRFV